MKAAIDIGTNTIRMMIGTIENGKINVNAQYIEETRLGVGIKDRILTPKAVNRTLDALDRFKKTLNRFGIDNAIVVATSAVRDAENKREFTNKVLENTGWKVRILSGEEEAKMSYNGAISALPLIQGIPVVVDIGGGSTEFIYCHSGQIKTTSVNVGAVRLAERMLFDNKLREELSSVLQGFFTMSKNVFVVGVGGTVTTAAAVYYGIREYSRAAVHGTVLSTANIVGLKNCLEKMSLGERQKVAGLTAKRADIIVPGLTILITVLDMLGVTKVWTSDAGLLDGLLLEVKGE